MESNSSCEDMNCKNGNSCQMSITNGSDPAGRSVRCLCRGRWAGPTCERELRLSVFSIQSELVLLELKHTTPSGQESQQSIDFQIEEFTVFLWNKKSMNSCRILQMLPESVKDEKVQLKGLEKEEKYVACVSNGHIDSCSFYSDQRKMENLSNQTNCLEIVMLLHGDKSSYMHIIATVCVTAVFLLVLGIFLYVHRRSLILRLCFHIVCCRSCRCCRSISRTNKSENVWRTCKRMHEASSDVLMSDDIPIDFEEFEAENDLSSPIYSCDDFQNIDSSREMFDARLLPYGDTSVDSYDALPKQTKENCALLYENQDIISPVYSPQDHNVMKLAFVEDDLFSQKHEQRGNEHNATEDLDTRADQEEKLFQCAQIGNKVLDLQRYSTLQTSPPLQQSYLSHLDLINHPFSSHTLPSRFRQRTSIKHFDNGHTDYYPPQRRRSLFTYGDPTPLLAPPSQGTPSMVDFDLIHPTRHASPVPFPFLTSTTPHDTSPEIEYSDASGDYRYPPVTSTYTLPRQNRTFRDHPTRSITAHDIKMRNLRFPRYKRPLSMPNEFFFQAPTVGASFPHHRFNFPTTEPVQPYFGPNFNDLNNLTCPSSYIPRSKTFQVKRDRYHSITDSLTSRQNQQQMPFLYNKHSADLPSSFSPFELQAKNYEMQPFTNTLPKAKKPKMSFDHQDLDDTINVQRFSSHSLPRAAKRKPTVTANTARRPRQLSLKTHALDFPQSASFTPTKFPTKIDNPIHLTYSFQDTLQSSRSFPNSPSLPQPPNPVKAFINHFENNLFSRSADPNKKFENQEFIDLKSPLADEKDQPKGSGKTKKNSKWPKNRMSNGSKKGADFICLADNSYKCFFKTDIDAHGAEQENTADFPLPRSSSSSSLPISEEFPKQSDSDFDKTPQAAKPKTRSGIVRSSHVPRDDSISCFAENTVNLVTPFCSESFSFKTGQKQTMHYTDVPRSRSFGAPCVEETEDITSGGKRRPNVSTKELKFNKNSLVTDLPFDAELEPRTEEPKEWELIV
ncbi:hypothetical protein ElyMa_001515000 [Elysia marginata]|uniref:EGF-like domain-containing protein n=1 Tax=Elysia marginata TaxID=1093978 RepID=A0AAV4J936_9GAST|nr:hypothetical protein ElyMa_001515000 [Elysia marginata]